MQIQTITEGKSLIAQISGEIDHHSAEEIRKKIDRDYHMTKAIDIILDFKNVNFMDSSGVGMIMGRYKNLEPYGKVKICGLNEGIKRIFDISGLGRIITEYETLNDALGGKYELR